MFSCKLQNESGNIIDINDGVNYVVLLITGLNPPPASLYTAKSPNRKGIKYNGSTLNERNVIITIKPLVSVEEQRNELYAWTDTEQYVKIYYSNGTKNIYCEGHVEECDFDLFTNNETIQIAIVCEDPYLKDLQEMALDISRILKQFTFPFSIDANGLPFSTIRAERVVTFFNDGAETGVRISVLFRNTVENFSLYDGTDVSRVFAIKKTFYEGDILEINTEKSPKTCRIIRNGVAENALKYLAGSPTWFTLKKGSNSFGYSSVSGVDDIEITMTFTNKYLGV